jgi:hypothetical protein
MRQILLPSHQFTFSKQAATFHRSDRAVSSANSIRRRSIIPS